MIWVGVYLVSEVGVVGEEECYGGDYVYFDGDFECFDDGVYGFEEWQKQGEEVYGSDNWNVGKDLQKECFGVYFDCFFVEQEDWV